MTTICHITSAHGQEDIRIFRKECSFLAKSGYKVFEVAPGTNSYDKNKVHIVGIDNFPKKRFARMIFGARKAYKKALELDCDLYHCHDPELLPYCLKLKKKGKKVIFDSHENYTDQIKEKNYLPKKIAVLVSKIYSRYEKYVFSKIDGLVHTCVKNGIDYYEGQCKHIISIINYPDIEEFYANCSDSIKPVERSVSYVGAVTHTRGVTNIVKAAYKANAKVLLAGWFNSEEYEKKLKELKEYEVVDFIGEIDNGEIPQFLQKSMIGMATLFNVGQYNQDDSLPTKVYEYMALSLPVIISESPLVRANVEKYKFGICVDPQSVDEICNAINYLLDNPDIAKQMGENGKKAVAEKFNWATEFKRLEEFYTTVLEEK